MRPADKISKKSDRSNSKNGGTKTMCVEDALMMMTRIMTDSRAADEFFLKTMRPKMEALAIRYNQGFGLDITPNDVAMVTYQYCWEDNWAMLRAFRGETSPHAWVARMAEQAIYKHLVNERYIDDSCAKANDYRLTVRGIKDDNIRQAIVDMVFHPEQHKALEMYYVNKDDKATLAETFGSEDIAASILKKAEKSLIERLLCTDNPFADMALSAAKPINREIQIQTWHDRIDEGDLSDNHLALRDLLSDIYDDEDWDANAIRFIDSVVAKLDWTDVQKEVWRERFFNKTPSKLLSIRFNVQNTWIDNTYSHLNRQFRLAVRTWWERMAG